MSVIFGIRQAEGATVDERQLLDLAQGTKRWASDGTFVRAKGRVGMGFQPYYTHERSSFECQPAFDDRGNMAVVDARLDNYKQLLSLLGFEDPETPDSVIILRAWMRWGEGCFAKLIGDWAIAIWITESRALYLARDHAGARTLYYQEQDGRLRWSTFLETLLVDQRAEDIDTAYTACFLASQPIGTRTPYKGIRAIDAAHYVKFVDGRQTRRSHWVSTVADTIRYRDAADYKSEFLVLFQQSIDRRTGPGRAILAELSGGMDSSAIVCTSDHLRRKHGAKPADLLDTVSYYDPAEPNWDEEPYFSSVEQARGKTGIHLLLPLLDDTIAPSPVRCLWPGEDRTTFENGRRLLEKTPNKDYRVIVSGLGGDELLGGYPNPLPELSDLIASWNFAEYARRCFLWSLSLRRPFLRVSVDVLRFTFNQCYGSQVGPGSLPVWASDALRRHLREVDHEHPRSSQRLQHTPSQIANGAMWWRLGETLPHRCPGFSKQYEYRYPFLDRDLVDFLLRVPRRQLLEPGRRRSLMRNALAGIVPDNVLSRRRKANRSTSVLSSLRSGLPVVEELLCDSGAEALGMVDPIVLRRTIPEAIRKGDLSLMQSTTRFVLFELWYRQHTQTLGAEDFVHASA